MYNIHSVDDLAEDNVLTVQERRRNLERQHQWEQWGLKAWNEMAYRRDEELTAIRVGS